MKLKMQNRQKRVETILYNNFKNNQMQHGKNNKEIINL